MKSNEYDKNVCPICAAKIVCWCGRELEVWQIDNYFVEGCKSCNKVYTYYYRTPN